MRGGMEPTAQETFYVIFIAISMCGTALALWLWSDRSGQAALLIAGLWVVAVLAVLVLGPPLNVPVLSATVLGGLLLYAIKIGSWPY